MTLVDSVKEVLQDDFFLPEDQADILLEKYAAVILTMLDPSEIADSIYSKADRDGFFREEDRAT